MNEQIPILRYTSEALATLKELARTSPELWRKADPTNFQEILAEHHVENATEDTGLVAQGPITMPMPESTYLRQRTDADALAFYQNIPGLTTRDISDPGLMAWLSCNFLQTYGQARWTIGNKQSLARWVNLHYLAERGLDLTNWSVAGRPLWMAHTALKAAQELSAITPRQIVEHFSRNPEQYHACIGLPDHAVSQCFAEFIMALVTEAEGISRQGARELARENNRYAGSRIISTLPQTNLREINNQTVDRLMSDASYVNDRSKIRGRKPLQVLGLGRGVQSTVMALMAETGYLGMEKPDFAIFADTGWEPPAVYENVEWLKGKLSYPIHVVSNGNIRTNTLAGCNPRGAPS